MSRIKIPEGTGGDPAQVWSMRPEFGRASLALIHESKNNSMLPNREREAARARIAELNSCPLCLDWRSDELRDEGVDEDLYKHVSEWRTWPGYTERERLAIEFGERFVEDHQNMNDEWFEQLRNAFSDEEIVDLTLCCGTYLAFGRFLNVLQLETCEVARR